MFSVYLKELKEILQFLADYNKQRDEWLGSKGTWNLWSDIYVEVVEDFFCEPFPDELRDNGMPIESVKGFREIRSLMEEIEKDFGIDDGVDTLKRIIDDRRFSRIRALSANLIEEIKKLQSTL